MTLIELFRAQVARTPDRIAVECAGRTLTFRELDEHARGLAAVLRAAGAGPEVCVGICLPRTLELVVGLLGIAASGAAYVPLDATHPPKRIAHILATATPRLIVTDGATVLPPHGATMVLATARAAPLDAPPPAPGDLAYVMFTSGSTGTPKGIAVEHHSLANLLTSIAECPGFGADDVLVAVTTIAFDISGLELYLPLVTGGRLVLAPDGVPADAVRLARLVDDSGATMLQATPATWRMLFAGGWRGKRDLVALCGGEPLPADLARELVGATRAVWNMYGPTETTIWSTLDRVGDGPISIGRPIANTHVELQGGELYIGGRGVARGYLGRPELTAERFLPDPRHPGQRIYRTGDLARWLPDGRLEHLGRADDQVKVRGFRIELGDIESALRGCAGVRDAVVAARELAPGDVRLVAYIVGTAEPAALAAHLREHVPPYMLPSAFVAIDRVPLSPSGKVDRAQLPAPALAVTEPAVPASPLEATIIDAWCSVLGIAAFDRAASFPSLGGHSLLATQLVSKLRAATGVQLPIDLLLGDATIGDLAREITARPPEPDIVAEDRTDGPTVQVQRYFATLAPETSFAKEYVAWRITGPLDPVALERAIRTVIERHAILRSRFTGRGPTVRQVVGPAEPEIVHEEATDLEAAIRPFVQRTFDLARGEVVRAKIVRLGEHDHAVVTSMHHVVFDYASWFLYADEVAAAYRGERLPPLPFQFADVARRLEAHAESPAGRAALDAWRRKLDGAEPVVLPADRPRDAVDAARREAQRRGPTGTHFDQYLATFPAGVVSRATDGELARAAIAFIERERTTPLSLLLAALALLLHRETGQTDLLFGTNVGTRPFLRADPLIGPFHSPTFVRVVLAPELSHRELLARVREQVVDMLRYATVPVFERVPHPIGRLGFGFFGLEVPEPILAIGGATTALVPPWPERMDTHVDLSPMVDLRSRALTVNLVYNRELFDEPTVARLAERYLAIVREIVYSG